MNIGLVRHFKVNCCTKMFMTSTDFNQWVKQYDNSDVIENKFKIGDIKWDKCFSSDLSRAIKTSQSIFKGEIIKTQLLREVPIAPIFNTNIKIPYIFWCISGRFAWLFQCKSQTENKKDTQKRVNEFLDSIKDESSNNILIVCHGFFMNTLQKELKSRGVTGRTIRTPKNGTLYLYKK
ncbi:phosphoglycerate mutase family protein [Clostridium estertheticum]|uniref:phosphoglycerate mutase family protein n=1 Tax=Clostridium estertheticum TaxID=238834 RepID=UPI001C0AD951|nr:histidine phosphatase family protein [Clostridium estertheticum]MBU3214006.1 phosphoglycerate mutase family protein [Clostridium estertheticum]WAG54965.1 phosphoglycerate mutase family protein [Clostridium estertheticum]